MIVKIRVFPNPQDALPLPRRANLECYRKLATELVTACKSGDPAAGVKTTWSSFYWIRTLI